MSDDIRHKYSVWDRLLLLLYPCDDAVTDAELDADLERLGIDMRPAFVRMHKMIETQRARVQFASAKERRASLSERLSDVVAPKIQDLRNGVRNLIGRIEGDEAQLAYFHKLEGVASEEDLQSLFDDLEKLNAMQELRNDSESK